MLEYNINATEIWPNETLISIKNSIKNSNSILLRGSFYSGKNILIDYLINTFICNNQNHCLECNNCKLSSYKNHPDILYLDENSDNDNTVKIDQIRNLIDFIQKKPTTAKYKIAVIYNINSLNNAGLNAILKILEEPIGNAKIILGSYKPTLATIASRCHNILVPKFSKSININNKLSVLTQDQPLKAIYYEQNNAIDLINNIIISKNSTEWINNVKGKPYSLIISIIQIILYHTVLYKLANQTCSIINFDTFKQIKIEKIYQAIEKINYINHKQSIQKNLNELALLNQISVIWFSIWK